MTNQSNKTLFKLCAGFILVACFATIAWRADTKDITQRIAIRGEDPIEYINKKFYPENFVKDWPPHQDKIYDQSWIMRTYYYLEKSLDLSIEKTISPMVLAQALLLSFAMFHIALSIHKSVPKSLLFTACCLTAPATSLDLARFSYGVYTNLNPLFYGWAMGFLTLGASFHLRDKYLPAFIALTLGALCHISMAFFFCVFVGASMLHAPKTMLRRDFIIGLCIFLPIVGWHAASTLQQTATTQTIPDDAWIVATKLFSFHWYPSSLGLFTYNAHRRFFPLIIIAALFIASLHRLRPFSRTTMKVLYGMAACIALGAVGYVTSEIFPIPFLIKLCPLRATSLLSFFLALYLVGHLYDQLVSGRIPGTAAAAWMLASMMLATPGTPVFAALALMYGEASASDAIRGGRRRRLLAAGTAGLCAAITAANLLTDAASPQYRAIGKALQAHLWTPLVHFHPGRYVDMSLVGGHMENGISALWLLGAAAAVCLAALAYARRPALKAARIAHVAAAIALLACVWFDQTLPNKIWMRKYGDLSKAYLAAEYWARDNTPTTSLFLVEPYRSSGWRAFSRRSSLGNLHDWGYSHIAYLPELSTYEQGQRLMEDFGIDWRTSFPDGTCERGKASVHLKRQLRDSIYSMTGQRLGELARKYDVDYVVLCKDFLQTKYDMLPIAYENDKLVIYKTNCAS